jgi:putative spermidine/putrescine transport system substrate-binding protein
MASTRPWRKAALLALAAVLAVGFGACGSDDSGGGGSGGGADLSGDRATVGTFGGQFDRALETGIFEPVTAATGLPITVDVPVDYAKIKAAVDADSKPPWDVAMADPVWTPRNCGKLLQRIKVDRSQIDPRFVTDDCSMPADVYSYNVVYRNGAFDGNAPSGWSDFFDTSKFPGKRAVWGSYGVYGLIEGALIADGVAPDDLYPLDLERAFARLDEIKGDLTFYDTLAQAEGMMVGGDVDLLVAVNLNGFAAAQNGAEYTPVWDGAMVNWNSYTVPKGAFVPGAKAILRRIGSREGQVEVSALQPAGPTVKGLEPDVSDPLLAEWNPSNPDNAGNQVLLDPDYYRENFDMVTQRFLDWVTG